MYFKNREWELCFQKNQIKNVLSGDISKTAQVISNFKTPSFHKSDEKTGKFIFFFLTLWKSAKGLQQAKECIFKGKAES